MSVFDSASFDDHELVCFGRDADSGLRAIIAVHNSNLGPAVGGCRMFPYIDEHAAIEDVLRLSRGMTYKSALAGLPMGGGKAVIIGDPATDKSPALLRAMGAFIERLGGRYVTAEDSGTNVEDIRCMGERTAYISGVHSAGQFGGDPSPYTALGVYCGMLSAARHALGVDALSGLRVAVQGAGAVGRHLIARLLQAGAEVLVADVNVRNIEAVRELGATIVATDSILQAEVDIFAPCAMGAVLDAVAIAGLRARVVAGAANNVLATAEDAARLRERGILYAPDFVINAGGIIDVYHQRVDGHSESSEQHVKKIGATLATIFERAEREGSNPHAVAEHLAEEIFRGTRSLTEVA